LCIAGEDSTGKQLAAQLRQLAGIDGGLSHG